MYIFDPASPRPVAVQAAVSRKTDIIAAAFYPTSLVRGSTVGHSPKMSKLYFLTAKQVSSLFLVFSWATLTRHRTNFRQAEKFDPDTSFTLNRLERFSYDVEMKTREHNRNNKRTEIERFDWFVERIQTRVAFGWL